MQTSEAIVLAGGLGTRLRSEIGARPKSLALINGRPFISYLVNYLKNEGVTDIIFSLGFGSEEMISILPEICGDLDCSYVVEDEPLGTGGAISLALGRIKSEDVFVMNGDTMFPVSLHSLRAFHKKTQASLSIALKMMNDFDRYGTVEVDQNGKITGFNEKKYCPQGYINGGIYLIHKPWWQSLDLPQKFSVERSVLEHYCSQGVIRGLPFDDYFIDIGIPDDYRRAAIEFEKMGLRW